MTANTAEPSFEGTTTPDPPTERRETSGGSGYIRTALSRFGPFLILITILLNLWESIVRVLEVPRYILPPPSAIVISLRNGIERGVIVPHG